MDEIAQSLLMTKGFFLFFLSSNVCVFEYLYAWNKIESGSLASCQNVLTVKNIPAFLNMLTVF